MLALAPTPPRTSSSCTAMGRRVRAAGGWAHAWRQARGWRGRARFTLRAFLNGRLDLTQAESVQQLVAAKTVHAGGQRHRRAAARARQGGVAFLRTWRHCWQGGIGAAVSALRAECIAVLAELEARLDFADEEIPPLAQAELEERLAKLQADVVATAATARVGQLMQDGLQVCNHASVSLRLPWLAAPTSASPALLNACSRTERAIVTNVPGTTRDVVEAEVNLGGIPVRLMDTAGLREASDIVEKLGVERSRATALAADVVIMVIDASVGWTDEDQLLRPSGWAGPSLLVVNKTDLTDSRDTQELGDDIPADVRAPFHTVIRTSAASSHGLDELTAAILEVAGAPQMSGGGAGWAVNLRQAEALTRAQEAFVHVQGSIAEGLPLDFWTIDLRDAAYALGEVTGDEVAEEVLDTVFSKFCIGK
eukprot:jgi/Tetstr1/449021/TSEL_036246.t1